MDSSDQGSCWALLKQTQFNLMQTCTRTKTTLISDTVNKKGSSLNEPPYMEKI